MVLPAAEPRGPVIAQQSKEGGETWCQPGQRQEESKGCCCLPGEGSSQLGIHTYSRNKRPLSQRKVREQHGSCERTSCTAILVCSWSEASCRLHVTVWMALFLEYRELPLGMRREWLATIRSVPSVWSGGNSPGVHSLYVLWPRSAIRDQIVRDINSLEDPTLNSAVILVSCLSASILVLRTM